MSKVLITVDELEQLRAENSNNLRIIDCTYNLSDPNKGHNAFHEGHIPGAIYMGLEEDMAILKTPTSGRHPLPSKEEFIRTLAQKGIQPSNEIIVYDGADSQFAARLWWMLKWAGCQNVRVLDGGFEAYAARDQIIDVEVGRTVNRPEPVAEWEAPAATMPLIDADTLQTKLEDTKIPKIDARAAVRFKGEAEPFDRIAGHIPGFQNRFYKSNVQKNGKLKSADELRAEFEPLLDGQPGDNAVVMCGSGVSACHHVLAMEHASLGTPTLYAGSWSEWIEGDNRPMACASE